MRESKLPIPHPSHPRFLEAVHRINRHADALAAGSTPEGSSDPVTGFSPALTGKKTFIYVIDEHIEGGRYKAHPVSHQLSGLPEPPISETDPIPPRDPDTWENATWVLGPECDGVVFPLVELNALETIEEGTRVDAWLSPAGDCMQFRAGGGGSTEELDYEFVCGYDEEEEVSTLSLNIIRDEVVIQTIPIPVICQDAITDVNCGEDGSVVATTEKRMYIDCSCLPPE